MDAKERALRFGLIGFVVGPAMGMLGLIRHSPVMQVTGVAAFLGAIVIAFLISR